MQGFRFQIGFTQVRGINHYGHHFVPFRNTGKNQVCPACPHICCLLVCCLSLGSTNATSFGSDENFTPASKESRRQTLFLLASKIIILYFGIQGNKFPYLFSTGGTREPLHQLKARWLSTAKFSTCKFFCKQ